MSDNFFNNLNYLCEDADGNFQHYENRDWNPLYYEDVDWDFQYYEDVDGDFQYHEDSRGNFEDYERTLPPLLYEISHDYHEEYESVSPPQQYKSSFRDSEKILSRIRAGADVEAREEHSGMTPLMLALKFQRGYKVVYELINAGSDITATCKYKRSVLMYALESRYDKNLITELVSRGANVDHCCDYGDTPMVCALTNKCSYEVISALIDFGADLRTDSKYTRSLFMEIMCKNCTEDYCENKKIIDLLIRKRADLKKCDHMGNTVLHLSNCQYLIELSIKYGVSVNTKNCQNVTPLGNAVQSFPLDTPFFSSIKTDTTSSRIIGKINRLLELGANPNSGIFFSMGSYSHPCLVDLLIYHRADLLAQKFNAKPPVDNVLCENFLFPHPNLAVDAYMKNFLLFIDENGLNNCYHDGMFAKSRFKSFLGRCKGELNKMRNTLITDDLTFYEFCVLRQFYDTDLVDISGSKYKYNFQQIKELLPNYHEIVILRIKDNQVRLVERKMRCSLENIILKPCMLSDINEEVALPYDCLYCISKYLNRKQLSVLFHASVD